MQQLSLEFKNIPTNAPQVCSSINSALNKEETLSVSSIVLDDNNLDVDYSNKQEVLKTNVFVKSLHGFPLMPCTQAKARRLIKADKAKIIKLYPFTIQLNFECENVVQDVNLGVDTGFGNIGFSCVSDKNELISGTIILDPRTSERLGERAMYRRGRRNKLWYRKPRFNNRKRGENRLPPSTQRRYDTHLNIINRMRQLMPISKVIIETANFDIQKIENPDIEGVGYQQGDMYGYQNMRSYLLAREKGLCQICGKEFTKGNTSHIHHIIERAKGGTDRANNLALLHQKCHIDLHKKGLKLKPNKQYKPNTFMSIIRKRFRQDVADLHVTYGYKTFVDRNELCLEKTHYTDAFIIAGGSFQKRVIPLDVKQKQKNNRCLQINRNGFAPSIRRQRYKIQPRDYVWIDGKRYISKGCKNKGAYVYVEGFSKPYVNIKKVQRVYHSGTLAF